MSSFSLSTLNYAAAALHLVQAIIVISLIPYLDHKVSSDAPPLARGIFTIQKNLYILQKVDSSPKCDLPALQNVSQRNHGTQNTITLNIQSDLAIQSTNFYILQDAYVIPTRLEVGYIDVRYLIFSFFLLSFLFQTAQGLIALDTGTPGLLRFVEYSFSASIMVNHYLIFHGVKIITLAAAAACAFVVASATAAPVCCITV